MVMSARKPQNMRLPETFANASEQKPSQSKARKTGPFCIRLTDEERVYLEEQVGTQPLEAYIRQTLQGEPAHKRRALR